MDVVVILCSSVLLWYLMLLSYMILVSSFFLFIFLKVLLMFKIAWMCVNGNSWMEVDFFSAVFETNLHVNKTKIIFVFWVSCCLVFSPSIWHLQTNKRINWRKLIIITKTSKRKEILSIVIYYISITFAAQFITLGMIVFRVRASSVHILYAC